MLKLADNLELPLDFMTERIAFLARTGAGKSGGMRVLFEQIFDAGQFSIFIDPKGDAYGIRAAGKKPGKPVLVMGGDHADVPLEASSGKVVAEFLVKERISTVLDISDFSTPDMWKFVAQFCATLYKLNREALHLFIDEADMLAGQTYFDPHTLHGIQLIQNKGRARGFGVTVATQRPQILNKTVLNASGTIIAMQTIGDDALKVVKSWLMQTATKEVAAEILVSIPTLQTREAFVYSPQILGIEPRRIRFAEFQTFDSMRTPKPGEARQTPKSLADIDLATVQRDMAATIEKAKADDPTLLKKKISELEKQLRETSKLKSADASLVEVEVQVPVLDEKNLKLLDKAVKDAADGLVQIGNKFKDSIDKYILLEVGPITKIFADLRNAKPALSTGLKTTVPVTKVVQVSRNAAKDNRSEWSSLPAERSKVVRAAGDAKIGKSEMNVLRALFWIKDDKSADMRKIAFLAGYSPNASTVSVALSNLRKAGYVDGRELTVAGLEAIPPNIEAKPTGSDLREWIRSKIGKTENAVLDFLLDNPNDSFTMAELAEGTGYSPTASTLSVALSRLRKFEAVEGGGRSGVRAADVFFED